MPIGDNPGALYSKCTKVYQSVLHKPGSWLPSPYTLINQRQPLPASSACLTLDVPQGLLFPGPERLHGGLSRQGELPTSVYQFCFPS